MVVAPLAIGATLYFSSGGLGGGNTLYLLIMVLTPVLMLANAVIDRFSGARAHRKALAVHRRRVVELDEEKRHALTAEERLRRNEAPDPATLLLTAQGPTTRLWERRPADTDAVLLRIGLANVPARMGIVELPDRQVSHPDTHLVPATIDLAAVHVLGVAGARRFALSRWLVSQLAVLRSPRDLRLIVLTTTPQRWAWIRWLPHLNTEDGGVAVYSGTDEIRSITAELGELAAAHNESALGVRRTEPARHIVVVMDNADSVRTVTGVPDLLAHGHRAGIFAICLADQQRKLPHECRGVVMSDSDGASTVQVNGETQVTAVVTDLVDEAWAHNCARALAPLRDVTPGQGGASLPTTIRLLDLLRAAEEPSAQGRDLSGLNKSTSDTVGSDELAPDAILSTWRSAPRNTRAIMGASADGVFEVDIASDGPHALVAGTTGAGKSELLQTLVASLALRNRPDQLSFILIDYKGGAAFAECATLPHTVGMVTDLDPRLTTRALVSLRAELRRREHLLASASALDIAAYQALPGDRPPLGRLVLIVDEFAALAEELPDFLAGLVDIARRGRSLGVHLVLATQRPAGVVSPEIKSNMALRMCLRVTEPGDSLDVIETADACSISRRLPGRAFVRSSQGLSAVQIAHVGGTYQPKAEKRPEVREWQWRDRPRNSASLPIESGATSRPVTDLAVIVKAITQAAGHIGQMQSSTAPWLPPLPTTVPLQEFPRPSTLLPPIGWHDEPHLQRRTPYTFDLAEGGHTLIVGKGRSGRSSALRTIAASTCEQISPHRVVLYVIDCGGGALAPIRDLPHCVALATPNDVDHMLQVLTTVDELIEERKNRLAMLGFGTVAEYHAADPSCQDMPYAVLLLDSWEGLCDAFGEPAQSVTQELLPRIVRNGQAAGVRVVLAGDRSLLNSPVGRLVADRLLLAQADRDAYLSAGLSTKDIPADMPPGRALRISPDVPLTEVQVAVLGDDAAPQRQHEELAKLSARTRSQWASATVLVPLPERVSLDEEWSHTSSWWLPLGVTSTAQVGKATITHAHSEGGEKRNPLQASGNSRASSLVAIGVDAKLDGPGVLIAGPVRSGRSTVLLGLALSHLKRGGAVCAITPRSSPLGNIAQLGGVVLGRDSASELRGALTQTLEPCLVVVDDLEALVDTPIDAALRELLVHGQPMVAAANADDIVNIYRGLAIEIRKSRTGVLLSQRRHHGDLFNVRVDNARVRRPGRGLLINAGSITPIQLYNPAPQTTG